MCTGVHGRACTCKLLWLTCSQHPLGQPRWFSSSLDSAHLRGTFGEVPACASRAPHVLSLRRRAVAWHQWWPGLIPESCRTGALAPTSPYAGPASPLQAVDHLSQHVDGWPVWPRVLHVAADGEQVIA